MWLPFHAKIWLYRKPIDFRKQIDGIVMLIADNLGEDPTSGQLFVFRNRKADKIRLLYWEDNGFWLLYKRNENSKFIFPAINDSTVKLSLQELQWLLSGLDFTRQQSHKKVVASHFF